MCQVSVIVLSYNNLENLEKTVLSICMQDFSSVQVIFGDDGSDKYDVNLMQRFKKLLESHNIREVVLYHNFVNEGTVRNYNKALSFAEGRWIIGLACGDVFTDSSTISKIVDYFKRNRTLLVTAKRQCRLNGNKYEILPSERQIRVLRQGGTKLLKTLCLDNFISGACTYYSKELFEQLGAPDERYMLLDDYPLFIQCLLDGIEIGFLDEITIEYDLEGVSNMAIPHPALEHDKRVLFEHLILPNRKRIGRFICRRLRARYFKADHRDKKWMILLYTFAHPDIAIWKTLEHIDLLSRREYFG